MKKILVICSIILSIAILAACSLDTSDGNKVSAPSNGDTPSTTTPTGKASIKSVCSSYSCYYGCKGVNIYDCKSDGNLYTNESGSYKVNNDIEPLLGKYIDKCGDGEACTEPDYTPSTTPTGGSSGGNSYCSSMGCGGLFCSGKCTGCPGCY